MLDSLQQPERPAGSHCFLKSRQKFSFLQFVTIAVICSLIYAISAGNYIANNLAEQHEFKYPCLKSVELAADEEKNLVTFVALGERSAITTVHHNLHAHFLGWDCVVFVHADESEISPNDLMVNEIASRCSIIRLPGLYWSHFLMTLTPELVHQYKHIAVLLDDLFAPIQGDTAVNVTKLLQQMQDYNLTSISPTVKGAIWGSTEPQEPCLWHSHHIETFFQIFTRALFICWQSFMHFSNRQGWCLDFCLDQQLCPSISRLGVDATMISYHLGNVESVMDFVPAHALNGTNLTSRMIRRKATGGVFDLCHKLNCSRSYLPSEKLTCNASHGNTTK